MGIPPPDQLVRPLGPSLLLRGPLSKVPAAGSSGARAPNDDIAGEDVMPTLTIEDMLTALERDTTLGRNNMVWRMHNTLMLKKEGEVAAP